MSKVKMNIFKRPDSNSVKINIATDTYDCICEVEMTVEEFGAFLAGKTDAPATLTMKPSPFLNVEAA